MTDFFIKTNNFIFDSVKALAEDFSKQKEQLEGFIESSNEELDETERVDAPSDYFKQPTCRGDNYPPDVNFREIGI